MSPISFLKVGPAIFSLLLTLAVVAITFNSGAAQTEQSTPTDVPDVAYKNISVATFDEMRKDRANIKIDVRRPNEIVRNSLGGALELDYEAASFVNELEKLDKNAHYLVFSTNGVKGAKAAQQMTDLGFANVSNLVGGMTLWLSTDRPPE